MNADLEVSNPDYRPPRHYSWPPFEPGNAAALKHGAFTPDRIAPLAAVLRAELVEAAPWTSPPAFAATVAAWAETEARVLLLRTYLDEVGLVDEATGEPRPATGALDKAERRADSLRQQLGLTPTAWAHLYRTITVDPDGGLAGAASVKAVGRQMLEAQAREATDE